MAALTNALLWVSYPPLMFERIGGMSVLERQLFTASRAGIRKVWISSAKPEEKRLAGLRMPEGLEILWYQEGECPPPYLTLSGNHFIRVETLRYIASTPYPAHVVLEDPSGAPAVQVIPFKSEKTVAQNKQALPRGASVFLESPVERGPDLAWLLAAGPRSQDGFMARHLDRHISLAISRTLLDTPVTPNMMTVLSSLLGLVGSLFFLNPSHDPRMAGAALVWLHSVLDGCDGELARLRFQESALGADIDFWGDNLVHLALFGCMAWGFFVADQIVLPLFLGLASGVGTLGSAILLYRERSARRAAPAEASAILETQAQGLSTTLSRVENLLAQRDFIYLLLFLAYIDRTYEFLWATAVGSLLFFGMTLYLGRTKNEQAIQPHQPRKGEARHPSARDGGGHQHLYSRR